MTEEDEEAESFSGFVECAAEAAATARKDVGVWRDEESAFRECGFLSPTESENIEFSFNIFSVGKWSQIYSLDIMLIKICKLQEIFGSAAVNPVAYVANDHAHW